MPTTRGEREWDRVPLSRQRIWDYVRDPRDVFGRRHGLAGERERHLHQRQFSEDLAYLGVARTVACHIKDDAQVV